MDVNDVDQMIIELVQAHYDALGKAYKDDFRRRAAHRMVQHNAPRSFAVKLANHLADTLEVLVVGDTHSKVQDAIKKAMT